MAGKPKIGEDPLWWIQKDQGRKTKQKPTPRTVGAKQQEWVRVVLEVRSRYHDRLNRQAEAEGIPARKVLDRILGEAFRDEALPAAKKSTARGSG